MPTEISPTGMDARNWRILAQEYPAVELTPTVYTQAQRARNWRRWKAAYPASEINPNASTAHEHARNWRILHKELV